MPKAGLEQIADGNGRNLWSLLAAGLEAYKVWLADVDFGSVFDDQQPVVVGDEVRQDIEERGFAGTGAATDEDVLSTRD